MKNSDLKVNKLQGQRSSQATVKRKAPINKDGKLTIDECANVAEDRGFTVDQFTSLVIHNNHTEEDFTKWLDARLDATAVKNDLPTPATESDAPSYFDKSEMLDVQAGYQGKQVIVDPYIEEGIKRGKDYAD